MPLQDGLNDTESVLTNPWASYSETTFASAVRTKDTQPAVRRRGSDGAARRRRNDHDPQSSSHSRSRTLDHGGDRDSGASSHPLARLESKKDTGFGSSWFSAHDTRPHMKRMLSNSDVRQEDSITEADAPITSQTKEERLVLVHEILPKDSLPGVALRYGVSLPDIRRANQLWPSDPIHLRKVLYIPLEKARHSKEVQNAILDIDSPTPSTEQDQSTQDNSNGEASTMSSPAKTKLTIIRVPASQLSFFPPSSTSAALKEPAIRTSKSMTLPRPSNASSIRSAIPPSLTQSDLPSPTSASTSSPISFNARTLNRSLGSLARVAPAAVQTFIGRLSIDSVSASASTQSEDREQGHELKNVSAASSLTGGAQGENLHSHFEMHPRDRGRGSSTLTDTALDTSRSAALVEGVELASLTPHFRHDPAGHAYRPSILPITSTAQRVPPSTRSNHASGAYTASESSPNPAKTVVRTAQPAPIPVMQLPLPSKRPKPRES